MAKYPLEFMPLGTSDLVRIGSQYDGGYVIPRRILDKTRSLLSFGLGNNWQFEKEFSRLSGARVVCFDHTIDCVFWFRCFFSGIYRGLRRLCIRRFMKGFCYIDYWLFFKQKKNTHFRKAIGYGVGPTISLQQAFKLSNFDEPFFLKLILKDGSTESSLI